MTETRREQANRHERMIRSNIRNFFLIATLDELRQARDNYPDAFSRACIDEMITECENHGVDSYAKVPN